nr:DUF6122 family protein [Pontibacter sp. BAB1700]
MTISLSFAFHMFLHLAVPLAFAALFYREQFIRASLIMLAGLAIDADHLLVRPILDPGAAVLASIYCINTGLYLFM